MAIVDFESAEAFQAAVGAHGDEIWRLNSIQKQSEVGCL